MTNMTGSNMATPISSPKSFWGIRAAINAKTNAETKPTNIVMIVMQT